MLMRTQRTIRNGPRQAISITHSVFATQGSCGVSEALIDVG